MPIAHHKFELNRIEGGGLPSDVYACIVDTEWYIDGAGVDVWFRSNGVADISDWVDSEDESVVFSDDDATGEAYFVGGDEWYGVRPPDLATTGSDAYRAVQISDTGQITLSSDCNILRANLSVSGAVPYVDYYSGSPIAMYKTGSLHWNSIEGAISQSNLDVGIASSGSTFESFISSSITYFFDETVTGRINNLNQISSSKQYQGYPTIGGSGIT